VRLDTASSSRVGRKHVVYLGILVAVAALGLLRLWLQQRKERGNIADLGSMKETLERVSTRPPVALAAPEWKGTDDLRHARRRNEPARRGVEGRPGSARSQLSEKASPLDGERREAARRRIRARRAARSRAVG